MTCALRLRGRRRAGAALVAGLLLIATGCAGTSDGRRSASGSGASTTTGPAAMDAAGIHDVGTFRVGRQDLELVDDTRVTAAHGDQPELPSRTLPTLVLFPAGPAAGDGTGSSGPSVSTSARPDGGPAPLIVFGHGSTRAGEDYLATLAAWASAGYVVVAPNFPLSTTGAPGGTDYGGIAEQTADVSFVIDQVLARSADAGDPLAGTVDPEAIGLGGQSFGAITAIATAYNACCADPRIGALTEFAGMWFDLGEGESVAPTGADVPGLFFHSEDDGVVPYAGDRHAAALAASAGAPVQFVTLPGGDHDAGFFRGVEQQPDELVTSAALAFYDQHLKGDADGAARLAAPFADAGADATLTSIPAN